MRRILSLLMLLVLLPAAALAQEGTLTDEVKRYLKSYKTVGAVVVAAKDGEIVYHLDYGYTNRKEKTPVTERTYFRIASVTKLVSAIRVMQLVEQGALALDEPLGSYMGFEVLNPRYRQTPVTLRHLMTHTSSISQKGSYGSGKPLNEYLDAALDRWGNWTEDKPGSKYAYSNFGAGLMGTLMELVTGKNVNDTVTEGVFAPLGIDAAYHAALLKNPGEAANLYNRNGSVFKSLNASLNDEWESVPDPMRHYKITVGDVWMRGDDLCRLGVMLCQGGTLDGVTILQPETVAEMTSSQKDKGGVTVDSPYGLAVHRADTLVKDRIIYGHQGMVEDCLCNLYWDPETNFVFAMITNGCNNNLDNRIAKLSRRIFGLMWDAYAE